MTPRARRQLLSASAIAVALGGEAAWADSTRADTAQAVAQGPAAPPDAPGATPVVAAAPLFSPDEELVLEVRTPEFLVSDGMIGYSSPRGVYLPLGEFASLLELAVSVEGTRAEGWFLRENRTFRLDLPTGEVEVDGRKLRLSAADAIAYDGDIYVRAPLLAEWFPLKVEVSQARLEVRLETTEPFPFEARAARGAKRGMIGAGQDRVEYPREETPYRLFTPPAIDVLTSAIVDTAGETSTGAYDVRASGDLLFMTADLFLGGSNDDALSSVRFALSRRDPDGRILGPLGLTDIQLGDTFSAGLPFGVRSGTGRGVAFSSAPLDNPSVFDRLDLRGELPLGYEVELYRNDVLIGSQNRAVDGRYEFLDVPLEFGRNVLRLIFYGPRGERTEEVRQIQVGGGRLGRGDFRFAGGLVQQDVNLFSVGEERDGEGPGSGGGGQQRPGEGDLRGSLFAEYGVNTLLTVAGGFASFTTDDVRRNQLFAGARTALADAAAQVDLAVQDDGWAMQGGLAGRRFGVSYVLQHVEYQGDFIDELRGGGFGLARASTGRFDWTNHLGASARTLSSSLVAERLQDQSGGSQLSGALRNSTTVGGWLVSNVLDYTRSVRDDSTTQSLTGALDGNGRFGEYNVRAGLSYRVDPDPSFRDLNFTVDRRIGQDLLVRLGVLQQLTDERTTRIAASVAKQFRRFDVSLDAQYDTSSKNLLFGVRVGFSLGWSPNSRRWFMDRPGLARGGSVLARAFRDLDGDGVHDPGEQPVAGLEFRGGGREARTSRAGDALLSGIGEGRPTGVSLTSASLEDPYLTPMRGGVEVVPRPGRTHVTAFPIVSVSEVEGEAKFVGAGAERAVSNVQLELLDAKGEVAGAAKTEYDGYFLFEKVRPGKYRLRIAPEQAERLAIRMEGESTVEASGEGGLVDGVQVRIVRIPKPAD